jgi:multiple sugar transport system substrate-binding protein
MMPRRIALVLGCLAALWALPAAAQNLTIWSHWADQQTKVAFVERAAREFEARNPGAKVQITWYQKGPMYEALGAALRARRGPDIFYIDSDRIEYIENGLLAPLDDLIDWNRVEPWARRAWVFNGKTYALPLEAFTNELFYNKALLERLGVQLPPSRQFSQAQFLDLVTRARAAGITPVMQGSGDRPYPGAYLIEDAILKSLGTDDFQKLLEGKLSWRDPRIAKAFAAVQALVDAKAYPPGFATITLGESHTQFYGTPGAVMLPMGSWYTSRAFNPPDKGGQPADFPLGIMQFPAVEGAACNDCRLGGIAGSFAINAASRNIRLAADLLNGMATPEMGNLWLSTVLVQTGVKADPATIAGPNRAYFSDLLSLSEGKPMQLATMLTTLRGRCQETFRQVLNVGFPAGRMRAPEAIEAMERACATAG